MSLQDINIRRAEEKDAVAVAELQADCFSHPATEDMLLREIQNDHYVLWIAEQDRAVIGAADFQFVLDEGYVGNIAVKESFRRQGIGRALLQKMVESAQSLSLVFLTLEVRASNAPAISLYASSGFETVGTRKNYYQNPAEDAILMTLRF